MVRIKKKNKKVLFIIGCIFILVFSSILLCKEKIASIFDKNDLMLQGHFVGEDNKELVVIGGVTGIQGIWFEATLKNIGNEPLNAYVYEGLPEQLYNAFSKTVKIIQPGEEVKWKSEVIDASSLGWGSTTFKVKIKQDFVCPNDKKCKLPSGAYLQPGESGVIYSEGTITYDIQPDESGIGSEFTFSGGSGSSETGTETENTTTSTTTSSTTTTTTGTTTCLGRCKDYYSYIYGECRTSCLYNEKYIGTSGCSSGVCCCHN